MLLSQSADSRIIEQVETLVSHHHLLASRTISGIRGAVICCKGNIRAGGLKSRPRTPALRAETPARKGRAALLIPAQPCAGWMRDPCGWHQPRAGLDWHLESLAPKPPASGLSRSDTRAEGRSRPSTPHKWLVPFKCSRLHYPCRRNRDSLILLAWPKAIQTCRSSTRKRCCGIGATAMPSGWRTRKRAFACSGPLAAARPAARPSTWPTATLPPDSAGWCCVDRKSGVQG